MEKYVLALLESKLTHASLVSERHGRGSRCICKGSRGVQVEVGGFSIVGHEGLGCPGPWLHNPHLMETPKALPCADAYCDENCNDTWRRR